MYLEIKRDLLQGNEGIIKAEDKGMIRSRKLLFYGKLHLKYSMLIE